MFSASAAVLTVHPLSCRRTPAISKSFYLFLPLMDFVRNKFVVVVQFIRNIFYSHPLRIIPISFKNETPLTRLTTYHRSVFEIVAAVTERKIKHKQWFEMIERWATKERRRRKVSIERSIISIQSSSGSIIICAVWQIKQIFYASTTYIDWYALDKSGGDRPSPANKNNAVGRWIVRRHTLEGI